MASNQYAAFFGAFKASQAAGNPLSKEEQIQEFTLGRTISLKDLSGAELEGLVASLNQMSGNHKQWKPTPNPSKGPGNKWRAWLQ